MSDEQSLAIGIDIDGTITEMPEFFQILTKVWPGKIYIISVRFNRRGTENQLGRLGIKYDELVLVHTHAQKVIEAQKRDIKIFFDDNDEVILSMPSTIKVLKIRNIINFDFLDSKWLYGLHAGKEMK